MHLLVITDGFPYPLTSGRLRQFHLLQRLSQHHRIALVSAVPRDHPAQDAAALATCVERIETVHSRRGRRRTFLAKVWNRFHPEGTRAVEQRIASLHATDPFDAVLNARLPLPLRRLLPGVPIVTDICDAVSDGLLSRMRFAPPSQVLLLLAKYLDARRDENQMAAESDHLLFASTRDRATLARRVSLPPSTVLPNGVDSEYWQRRTTRLGRNTIVFAGAMSYAPNEDAAIHLIRTIMPIVRRSRPDARLLIVGRDPTPRLFRAARAQANVEVTGYVEDMRDYLEQASVVVAALRYATGIQNKVLEAMSMAVPVVLTPIAEAGLLRIGDDRPPLAVASDPEEIAAFAVRRLEAADRWEGPDLAARAWVSERFRWDVISAELDVVIRTTA